MNIDPRIQALLDQAKKEGKAVTTGTAMTNKKSPGNDPGPKDADPRIGDGGQPK